MKTFTREDLNNKKYADLLRILKNLGIKGKKQKTEKVIALILAQQDNHENEYQNRTDLSKEINDEKGSEISFNQSFENSQTEFSFDRPDGAFTSVNSKGVDYQPSAKQHSQISSIVSKPVRRSSTFTVNSPEEIQQSKSNQPSQMTEVENKPMRRSSTFTMNSPEEIQQSKSNQFLQVTEVVNKPVRRSSTYTVDSPKVNQGSNSKHISSMTKAENKPMRRSSTFTVDSPEENQPSDSKKLSLTKEATNKLSRRSSTFTVENSKLSNPSRITKKSEDHKRISKESPNNHSKTLDLYCGEIQTARDIQLLENLKETNTSPISSVKRERVWRRSLRGQLLEAKALKTRESTLESPSSKSDASPAAELNELKRECEATVQKQRSPSISKLPNNDPSEKKSGIPRFVSYALKMPNFARMHAKAFQKMEALDDYVDRKRTRTKSVDTTVASLNKESRGQSFAKLSTPVATKKAHYEKASRNDQQPKTMKKTTRPSTAISPKGVAGKNDHKSSCPKISSIPTSLPQLVKENVPPGKNPSNVWNKMQTDSNILGSLQKRKEYGTNQRMKLTFNTSKDATQKNVKAPSVNVQRTARREKLKNNAQKRPKIQTRAEMRATEKVFIKGVRTNRRFELQMANRGIQI